jgi:hypothetical protein
MTDTEETQPEPVPEPETEPSHAGPEGEPPAEEVPDGA